MVPCASGLFGGVLPQTHGNDMVLFWEAHVSKKQQNVPFCATLSTSPGGQLAGVCCGPLLCVICRVTQIQCEPS